MTVQFERRPGYLYASLGGEFHLVEAMTLYRQVLQAALRDRASRILLDSSRLGGSPTTDERREFGSFMAEEQGRCFGPGTPAPRIAILASAAAMDPGRYLQTVANNRGVRVRASDSLQELLSWLEV